MAFFRPASRGQALRGRAVQAVRHSIQVLREHHQPAHPPRQQAPDPMGPAAQRQPQRHRVQVVRRQRRQPVHLHQTEEVHKALQRQQRTLFRFR